MPKIQPAELPLFESGELLRYVVRDEYAPKVLAKEWLATSTKRRLFALHVAHPDGRMLRGEVPSGKRFSFLEHTGEVRVWQHSERAFQPCPDRDALLTGEVRL